MQQYGSKNNARRIPPTPDLGIGSKFQNSTFSEHGHVAYQIKVSNECSNMVANILSVGPIRPPPRPWGVWSQ